MPADFKQRPTLNGTGLIAQGEPTDTVPMNAAPVTLTSQTAAFSETNIARRCAVDLTNKTQARFTCYCNVASAVATSVLRIQYSTDAGATWSDWSATATDVDMLLNAIALRVTAWLTIPVAARRDVHLRIWHGGGNGTASPGVTLVTAQFR